MNPVGVINTIKGINDVIQEKDRELKEMEVELKSLDNLLELGRAKERKIMLEIEANEKILQQKQFELQIEETKLNNVWKTLKDDKMKELESLKSQLDEAKQKIMKTRSNFSDDVTGFIKGEYYHVLNNAPLGQIIRNRYKRKELLEETEQSEKRIKVLEVEAKRAKENYVSFTALQEQKDKLLTVEKTDEYKRLNQQIIMLERELACRESGLQHGHSTREETSSDTHAQRQTREGRIFVPKVPLMSFVQFRNEN